MKYPYQKKSFHAVQKTVAAAGTAEALSATSKLVFKCKIRALTTNTGAVYIGDSTASATVGYPLAAGVEIDLSDLLGNDFEVFDLSEIYVDSDVNAEGIAIVYFD